MREAYGERTVLGLAGSGRVDVALEVDSRRRPVPGHVAHGDEQRPRTAAIDVGLRRPLEDGPEIEAPLRVAFVVVERHVSCDAGRGELLPERSRLFGARQVVEMPALVAARAQVPDHRE